MIEEEKNHKCSKATNPQFFLLRSKEEKYNPENYPQGFVDLIKKTNWNNKSSRECKIYLTKLIKSSAYKKKHTHTHHHYTIIRESERHVQQLKSKMEFEPRSQKSI